MQSMPYQFVVSYVQQQFGFVPTRFNPHLLTAAYQAFLLQQSLQSQTEAAVLPTQLMEVQ